ncbi:gastrula zinc finger protein XlCGF26.1 isoform X42 [Tribolium castaneum]|uniref:gastrula zinc finger protein XlCGF26.1 isoform X42 n=1 Tax=Tribolium castaneum TaxID=7070 RepID=UPI0030FE4211
MGSIENISELCRLCLVKDQVNVPIFEENATKEQTFVKINSCLPVKVSRDDSLPKKICDGCSCKLDMLYTFRNTSVDSEKQLLKWLNQAGLSCSQSAVKDPLASTKPEVTIKQETFEPTDSRDDLGLDTHSYIMQQQKLPYSQEFEFGEPSESNVGLMTDEPAPKKAKRAAALNKASVETDEDDLDAAMQITKAEDEDSDEIDQPEYVEAPSTSADDQPGPSGVNKTTVEAPFISLPKGIKVKKVNTKLLDASPRNQNSFLAGKTLYFCSNCNSVFKTKSLLSSHAKTCLKSKPTHICKYCDKNFSTIHSLKGHLPLHESEHDHICLKCGKIFTTKETKEAHMTTHHTSSFDYTTSGKFSCKFCQVLIENRKNMINHIKSHGIVTTPGLCDICGKNFDNERKLVLHQVVHQSEKPFSCDLCQKSFKLNRDLRAHKLTHETIRRFICEECGRSFRKKVSLNDHKKTHSGDFQHQCHICSKKFVAKSSLLTHLKRHQIVD